MLNRELLQEVRDWVAKGGDDQYEHEQSIWYVTNDKNSGVCETSCCVAGYAVARTCGVAKEWIEDPGEFDYYPKDGASWSASGAYALGLTPEQADRLFYGENTQKEVLHHIDQLLADA